MFACSSKDLHVILRALMATRNQKQLESEFRQALLLSFTQLDKLSPGHLCSLVIAAGQCKQNMPYRKLQVNLDRDFCLQHLEACRTVT